MAAFLVRNMESGLIRHLKKRAGGHGVSLEEGLRRIPWEALQADGAEKHKSFSCVCYISP